MEEKAKEIAELLKVLANKNRLLILCALAEGPLSVGEILKHTGDISQSALSQHLTLLRSYGILDCEKKGQNILYFIHDHKVEKILEVLKQYYCN